jgi:hypothetical protein
VDDVTVPLVQAHVGDAHALLEQLDPPTVVGSIRGLGWVELLWIRSNLAGLLASTGLAGQPVTLDAYPNVKTISATWSRGPTFLSILNAASCSGRLLFA